MGKQGTLRGATRDRSRGRTRARPFAAARIWASHAGEGAGRCGLVTRATGAGPAWTNAGCLTLSGAESLFSRTICRQLIQSEARRSVSSIWPALALPHF